MGASNPKRTRVVTIEADMIENIETTLTKLVVNYLTEKKLPTSSPLDMNLATIPLDSLEQVELFMLVEQEWNIDIDAKDLAQIVSMRDLVPYLEKTH